MTVSATHPSRLPPLRDRRQIARYVASVLRAAHRSEMPLDRAKTLAWLAQVLANLIADADADARLAALEARLEAYEAKS